MERHLSARSNDEHFNIFPSIKVIPFDVFRDGESARQRGNSQL